MKYSKGYTLLFAVIVSVLVLSIAAFILSVSRKQAILSSSARDSIYAFYSADSGLDCALENISVLSTKKAGTININCGKNSSISATQVNSGDVNNGDAAGTSTFDIYTGSSDTSNNTSQSGLSSCAVVSVSYAETNKPVDTYDKDGKLVSHTDATYSTTVISRGYNIGWDGSSCSLPGPRKVERALEYYQAQ